MNRYIRIPHLTKDIIWYSNKTISIITYRVQRGQPFSSRLSKGCKEQTRQYDRHTQNKKKTKQEWSTKEASPWNGQKKCESLPFTYFDNIQMNLTCFWYFASKVRPYENVS